jgi:flagellar basal body-associated protein FliL
MARRVELDLLEQDSMAAPPRGEPDVAGSEAGQAPEVRSSLRIRFRDLLQKTFSRFKSPDGVFNWKSLLGWKVIAAAGVGVVLVAAASVPYVMFEQKETEQASADRKKQAAAAVPTVHEAVFPDFSIDLKDAQGRYRFLLCDVTLEFQSAVELTEDRKVEIRKVIYLSAKTKGTELIRVSDSGDRFKREIREELRAILGEGTLKEIYITRYVLI